ncbi:V-snare-domain-containing protein [Wallemia mellicola]|uniref:V-snare-domain-containing protein n=2 Tax=Wallemia mellicola TaxID=1708541 RepID=A0A4T0R0M4_9BASI|nr:V-snare-domain-containing protein [Wallemia mellicola CBS 633.66]TIB71211.1 hypothetical protein E3Q23_03860 [Wallemia mellicola]EIM23755.1 V-snare-domain-containing protein [Wallemia mellicola CBS 633.66]TIB74586.1 V-snare-domain-containing protein [Wallemia mellicola]TIB79384.1 V-snare-domain-containing protein [Wallemia mellicola]TIB83571.1 V-snare-domain-containing protein [Wallemia mellicola]|eukprot:XP_006956419.1 V-snare-domain-containing protein [Wallemia mellicola CBS 633.66]
MTSVELIDNYFLDYENIIDTVSNKLYTDISAQSGLERKSTLRWLQNELNEADDILTQIEFEIPSLAAEFKDHYQSKLRSNKSTLSKLKDETGRLLDSSDRHELLAGSSDSPYYDDQQERQDLLLDADRMDNTNARLENSHRIALDTEDVGAEILRNLRQQREQIENTHNTLGEADTGIDRSMRTLKKMWRHSIKQKAVTWLIIGILVLLILIVLWGKFM